MVQIHSFPNTLFQLPCMPVSPSTFAINIPTYKWAILNAKWKHEFPVLRLQHFGGKLGQTFQDQNIVALRQFANLC